MSGIFFALLAAFFIGTSGIFFRKSFAELKPSVGFFFDSLFGLLIWVPLALFIGVNFGVSLQEALFYAVISAILSEALYIYALSHGELSITVTIIATYPIYTVLFSRFLNDESLTLGLSFFVALAILGSVWATWPEKIKKRELRLRKEIVWPFVTAIGIGFSDTISKGFIDRSGDFSFLFMLGLIQLPIALVYLRIEKQKITKEFESVVHSLHKYKNAILGGLFNIIGTGFLWLSFNYTFASIASPITGASGAVTIILAHLALREKSTLQKKMAIFATFIGIVGISILSA